MAEITVHLNDQVAVRVLQHLAESRSICSAEPLLLRPVKDGDVGVRSRDFVGETSGSVGRVVVDYEHPCVGARFLNCSDERRDVFALVVGGYNNPGMPKLGWQ